MAAEAGSEARTVLDPALAKELLRRQEELQAEARDVLAALDLEPALAKAGRVERMGSFVTGLMVWRDLDLNVICPSLALDRALDAMRPSYAHPRVHSVQFKNERGPFNTYAGPEDDRYYFKLFYRAAAGDDWKLDVSFWLADPSREERLPLAVLLDRLTDETRLAILWIKSIWWRLPTYRMQVSSVDIYDAVLDAGVCTPDHFDAYLRERGKPGREG